MRPRVGSARVVDSGGTGLSAAVAVAAAVAAVRCRKDASAVNGRNSAGDASSRRA